MEVTVSPERFRDECERVRMAGRDVGFVPTMGDLHRGHARLVKQARNDCAFVAVSVFVNPLQFDSPADLAAYPRMLDKDQATAASLGVDLIFAPDEGTMYPGGEPEVAIDAGPLGERFEGRSRPGHFRGVLTVVAKLFNVVGPCRAYFGEKDAQQLALVRRMARDLDTPVTVVSCPTVREADGLAVSSRNARLSAEERGAASVLFEALSEAATRFRQGERRADVLRAVMARRIGAETLAKLDYVALVDEATWEEADSVEGPARALAAAYVGDTRLIDNLLLPWPPPRGMHNTEQGGA